MSLKRAYLLVVLVLLIDQISKIYIKTHFFIGESINVLGLDWFRIHFIENEGMAWGAVIPGEYGKLILTLFRIGAVFGIGWWLWDSVVRKQSNFFNSSCDDFSLLKVTIDCFASKEGNNRTYQSETKEYIRYIWFLRHHDNHHCPNYYIN